MCPGAKAYEKAEDPIYALENNLPIDVQHYLDHQLAQPLMRIFEPVCKDVKAELLSGEQSLHGAVCCLIVRHGQISFEVSQYVPCTAQCANWAQPIVQ